MADNKVISILKSIGAKFKLGAVKAIQIEAKLLPFEKAAVATVAVLDPAVGTTLYDLVEGVASVEQVAVAVGASTGTGLQKLDAAVPAIEKAILSDPLFAGKKIIDLTKYNTALSVFTGALADLLDAFEAHDQNPTPAAPAAPALKG